MRVLGASMAQTRCAAASALHSSFDCYTVLTRRVYSRANWHASHGLHFDGTRAKYDIKSISTRNPKPVIEIPSQALRVGGGRVRDAACHNDTHVLARWCAFVTHIEARRSSPQLQEGEVGDGA